MAKKIAEMKLEYALYEGAEANEYLYINGTYQEFLLLAALMVHCGAKEVAEKYGKTKEEVIEEVKQAFFSSNSEAIEEITGGDDVETRD